MTCRRAQPARSEAAVAPRTDLRRGRPARSHGATFVDTTDWFCTPESCPVVVGNLLVIRDETHITAPMAEFLGPLLEATLQPAL